MGLISFVYEARVNYCPKQWSLIHNRASKTDFYIRFHVYFPQVIGDKKASVTTARLHHEKGLHDLRKLEKVLGIPIKLINVIRNPFDNIATICRRLDVNPGSHQIVSKYRSISSIVSHWFLFFMGILDFF